MVTRLLHAPRLVFEEQRSAYQILSNACITSLSSISGTRTIESASLSRFPSPHLGIANLLSFIHVGAPGVSRQFRWPECSMVLRCVSPQPLFRPFQDWVGWISRGEIVLKFEWATLTGKTRYRIPVRALVRIDAIQCWGLLWVSLVLKFLVFKFGSIAGMAVVGRRNKTPKPR